MKLLEDLTTGAVEHPLVTILIGVFIALLGAFGAAFVLPLQQEPPVKIPVIVVSIPYPGASPWEVQSDVIRELEEKLKGLENVDHIFSTSAEGYGVTSVKFTAGFDVDEAKREVRDRADQAKVEFPLEVEEPIVSDVDFDDLPVLFITLTDRNPQEGSSREEILMDLNLTADALEDSILQVNGVSTVDRYGELKGEVRLRLDPKRMEAYGLSFRAVAKAISDQNIAMPGGTLDIRESTFAVRLAGKFDRPNELKRVVVGRSEGGLIHLKDIVESILTYKKATSYSRLAGFPAVTLVLRHKTGENVVRLIRAVKGKVEALRESGTILPSVTISYTKDQSFWIWDMLSQLGSSALFGGILVVVVLYFGMGMRSGFLLASAIPFSILFCCLCQTVLNISINSMTLFSLILILGMVVDGAIVVGENIYRHFEMGKRPKQAALDGTHEVGVAVISADLTTISAFLPMLFMTGIMGFWMEIMPMIVTFTLAGSILVDHFFLPVLCRYFMRVRPSIVRPGELLNTEQRWTRSGWFTRWTYVLARRRILSFAVCLLPAIPLGWYGLEHVERFVSSLGAFRPDWTENLAYRFLAIFLVAVGADYVLRRRFGVWFGRRPSFNTEKDLQHLLRSGGALSRFYMEILRFSLSHRFAVAVIGALALWVAILLPASGRLRTAFFEDTDSGWYFIKYELPPDASIESNYEFAARLERVLKETMHPCRCLDCSWTGSLVGKPDECPQCGGKVRGEIKSTVTTMGDATAMATYMGEMGRGGPEFGQIEVELYPKEQRLKVDHVVKRRDVFAKSRPISFIQSLLYDPEEEIRVHGYRDMFQIMDAQKEWLHGPGDASGQDRFPGVKVDVMPMPMGPPVGSPITVRVKGRNLAAITETAKEIESICRAIPECYGIQNTHHETRREVRVVPDRDRAAMYGLSPRDVSRAMFTAFQGWEVSKMTWNDEQVDIRLENDDIARRRIEDVRDMEIATPRGHTVSLREIARVEVSATVSQLKRFDRRQSITVTSEIKAGSDTGAVKRQVKDSVAALSLPEGVSIEFGGQDEEQTESVQSLLRAFVIALVLIFFILTGQFNSIKQPLLVMLTIPLSIVGALAGLYLTGNPLDFLAMVGIVCLTGIVVNDAIVFVDFLNKLRQRGAPLLDATLLAGKARLRPILMTTITTVVGLLPLTLNLTGGTAFWETMGFSIIFGLGVATVLTLVVIPTFYSLVERDAWEASVLGRWRRPLRAFFHRRELRHLLRKLTKASEESERRKLLGLLAFQAAQADVSVSGVEELLTLRGHAYRRLFLRRAVAHVDTVDEGDLAPFALLCRRLSGCTWRVDTRLGEYQRPMIREDLANWVKHDGNKAPLGTLEKLLEAEASAPGR